MAKLDFSNTAKQLVDKVRAFDPVMKCHADLNGNVIKLFDLKISDTEKSGRPGEVLISSSKEGLVIKIKVKKKNKKKLDKERAKIYNDVFNMIARTRS